MTGTDSMAGQHDADGAVAPATGAGSAPGAPSSDTQWRRVLDLAAVRQAAERLAPIGVRTPLQRNERLSARHRGDVLLKREDLQAVRSYKIRGAYNFIRSLPGGPPPAGVTCASAGNHAQGVAWSCRHLGVRGTVFLPGRTPRQKVDRIRTIGGELVDVRFAGNTFDDAAAAAAAHAEATGATIVPAFDHPATAAGQGTVALEVVEELGRAPDVLVVPIGGGGLVAGVGACLDGLAAATTLIGAQPAGAPAMARSMAAGEPVTVDIEDDFVDGAVVRTPGRLGLAVARELVRRVVVVPEGRICTEQLALYQDDGIVAEPAGALAIAALEDLADEVAGRTVVCILSGGNNDVARYDEIIERSLVHRGLKHYFLVEFPQQPGALRRFLDDCLGPDDDITLFEYMKKSSRELGPALVGIELARRDDLGPLLDRMAASGLEIERMTPGSPLFRFLL